MRTQELPWDWEQKEQNFRKPGDEALFLRPGLDLSGLSQDGFQLLLSRGPAWDPAEIRRILKPGGFFLMECEGGEDSRALAEFLVPGCRPANVLNLENQLPLWREAGFRVMYRNQAYPWVRFDAMEELLRYIDRAPERFPGFSRQACAPQLQKLEKRLEEQGFLENREHRFILIVKKKG